MNPQELLLASASRLVHIGPPKTGTTSLQASFHSARSRLGEHGVHYAGTEKTTGLAALAVAGGGATRGWPAPRPEDWTELVDEARGADDKRVVVSSEFFCYGDEAAARRVVTEITGGPVHVVVTLRPIYKIAPSQWQQYVQNGLRVPYAEWLDGMFRRPPYDQPTPSFWRRHRHGDMVRRWAKAAGQENLTVVVVDETNPDTLLRTFESFVGLPAGFLVPRKNAANRSLSFAEAELVRLLNVEFAKRGWSDDAYYRFVRRGAVLKMKTDRRPEPDEARVTMPRWALERAAEASAEAIETIKSLGVRVVGDLATLVETPGDKVDDDSDLTEMRPLPADALALAVVGAIAASGRVKATKQQLARAVSALAAGHGEDAATSHGLPDLPPVPADAAALAVLGAITVGAALAPVAQKSAPATDVPVEQQLVRAISTRELVRVVMQRGRRRLRRQLGSPPGALPGEARGRARPVS
jgi:hypothetical protein